MTTNDLLKGKIPCEASGIEIKKSICAICDPVCHCGMNLYVKDGEIIKVEGMEEHKLNRGTLCAKGAATRQFVYNADRLTKPLRRVGEKGEANFEEITWDDAYSIIAAKLLGIKKTFGPESVAFYSGYAKWMRPYLQRLAFSFGSPNYCTESSTCNKAMLVAWKSIYGAGAGPDIKNTNCTLVWTGNPMHSNTPVVENLFNKKDNGMKMIVVDPRITPTTELADIHLRLKPGTDGALALGIGHVIVNENLYDKEFVENYSVGFDEYKEYIKEFPPERASEITGVPAEKIIEAARLYATTKPAAFMPGSQAVIHHTNGVQNYRAAMMLVGLTGNFDVHGGNVVQKPSYLNIPAGIETNFDSFIMPVSWSALKPRIGQEEVPVWCEFIEEAQAMFLPNYILDSDKPYPIKAIIGFGLNHRMWPDTNGFEKALKELDFFVNLELYMTDTNRFADLVLPVCTTFERSEFKSYPGGFVIHTLPVIEPLGDSISDVDFIFELSKYLELEDDFLLAGYETCLDYILEPAGLTMNELVKHSSGFMAPSFKPPIFKKYEKCLKTPSGKMEFVSGAIAKYKHLEGHEPLPKYEPPRQSKEATPELFAEYPFIINTGARLPMLIHSRGFRMSWTNSLRPNPAADINPTDAAKLGIKQGDTIKICTPLGEISVLANITQMALAGVVFMHHGYKNADVNTLIDANYYDRISGYPGFKSFLGKIVKVGQTDE